LHIGIDAQTLQVRAICVTSNNVTDAAVPPQLLEQIPGDEPLLTATGDGAYDTQPVQATVIQRNATPIIVPRKNARMRKGDCRMQVLRSRALEKLALLPPTQPGGDQDELHQTAGQMSRSIERQVNALHIRAAILNRFIELGCPQTVAVVSHGWGKSGLRLIYATAPADSMAGR